MLDSHDHITSQLDALTAQADARRRSASSCIASAMGGAGIDFMTPEERALRHTLILQLPTQAEERDAARRRIADRIAARRSQSSPVQSGGQLSLL